MRQRHIPLQLERWLSNLLCTATAGDAATCGTTTEATTTATTTQWNVRRSLQLAVQQAEYDACAGLR
jgi:hypothetical protein